MDFFIHSEVNLDDEGEARKIASCIAEHLIKGAKNFGHRAKTRHVNVEMHIQTSCHKPKREAK